jgi:hypothetical protein
MAQAGVSAEAKLQQAVDNLAQKSLHLRQRL